MKCMAKSDEKEYIKPRGPKNTSQRISIPLQGRLLPPFSIVSGAMVFSHSK